MRRLRTAAGIAVLLLLAVIIPRAWGGDDAPQDRGKSPYLASFKTYVPKEFQQSRLDRLSGGLAQGIPYRMAADSQGRILVTDTVLSVVHVFDTKEGKRWQIKGDRNNRLYAPTYIAVDADNNIYLTELGQSVISVLHPGGRFLRTIGLGVLKVPAGIWIDKRTRRLYVADWLRSEILSFDLEGRLLEVFGSWGTGPGQLYRPLDVVVHGDTLVVLDAGNSRFEVFDLQGHLRHIWPYGPNRTPIALACDAVGNLYYIDLDSGGLVAMDREGKVLAGAHQRPFGQLVPQSSAGPNFIGLALDPLGKILALRPTLAVEVFEPASDAG